MVKRQTSTKRKASSTSTSNISSPTTRSAAAQQQAAASLPNKKQKVTAKAVDKAMFGKGKKNKQSNGNSNSTNNENHNNVNEMFLSIAEDPDDPNSVVNMEGKFIGGGLWSACCVVHIEFSPPAQKCVGIFHHSECLCVHGERCLSEISFLSTHFPPSKSPTHY
jgi:hypothetical protein